MANKGKETSIEHHYSGVSKDTCEEMDFTLMIVYCCRITGARPGTARSSNGVICYVRNPPIVSLDLQARGKFKCICTTAVECLIKRYKD